MSSDPVLHSCEWSPQPHSEGFVLEMNGYGLLYYTYLFHDHENK